MHRSPELKMKKSKLCNREGSAKIHVTWQFFKASIPRATFSKKHKNKVDEQNNILHTLREASSGSEKAIFHISFPAPSHP